MFPNRQLMLKSASLPDHILIIFGLKEVGYGAAPVILTSKNQVIGLIQIVPEVTEKELGKNTIEAIVGKEDNIILKKKACENIFFSQAF